MYFEKLESVDLKRWDENFGLFLAISILQKYVCDVSIQTKDKLEIARYI